MARAIAEYLYTAKDNTSAALRSVKSNIMGVEKAMSSMMIGGVLAATAAIGIMVSKVTEADDRLSKMAFNLGFSTEALSEYEFAAKLSGIETEGLLTSIKRLQKNVSDAEKGLTTAKRAFEDLGLAEAELIRLAPEEQFKRVISALGNLENQSVRTRVAQDLFGRSGIELLKLVEDGAAGFERMTNEARLLGVTLDGDIAKATEEWNDAWTRVRAALTGTARDIAALRNESLTDMINDFAFKIPAAVFAGSRALDEFMLRLGALADANRSEKDELGFFGKAFALTPFGAAKLAKNTWDTYQENLRNALPEFEKETQEMLDQIFNRKFGPRDAPAPQLFDEIASEDSKKVLAETAKQTADIMKFLADEAEAAEKAQRDHQKSIDDYVTSLQRQIDTMNLSSAELVEYELRMLWATDATIEHAKALDTERMTMEQNMDLQRMLSEDALALQQEMKDETEKTNNMAQQLGLTFTSAFEDMAIAGAEVRDVLQGLFQDIQRLLIRKTVTEPLMEAFGSILGSLDFGSLFGGARAMGGPVMAGVPYLVGEQGPELFMPRSAGAIVPNDKLGGGGPSIVYNIDARGSQMSESRMRQIMKQTSDDTIRRIQDMQARNRSRV